MSFYLTFLLLRFFCGQFPGFFFFLPRNRLSSQYYIKNFINPSNGLYIQVRFNIVRDLKEIPDNIKSELEIKPVRWIDEVLDIVLTRQPIPWEKDEESQKLTTKKSKPKKGQIKAH